MLLEAGADPNGSQANLCSPLAIMCQRGFYTGVKLLVEFGADTEDIMRILSGMPGLPITSCATYHHLGEILGQEREHYQIHIFLSLLCLPSSHRSLPRPFKIREPGDSRVRLLSVRDDPHDHQVQVALGEWKIKYIFG